MTKLFYILLLLIILPVFGLAQNDIVNKKTEKPSFKNQVDLDVYFLGVEGSYKGRVSNKLFVGIGLGGLMLKKELDELNLDDGFLEIIRLRPFLDFQTNKYFHIETGLTLAGTLNNYNNDAGYSIGIEPGIFLKVWRLELGLRPSLLFYMSNDDWKFDSPILTTSFLIIKLPLSRW